MLRMTIVLLAGIFVTMVIAGRDQGVGAGIEVTRLDHVHSAPPFTPVTASDLSDIARALPLDDLEGAIGLALAATATPPPRPDRTTPDTPEVAEADNPPDAVPDQWFVTGSRVNLRAGPSTGTEIVGQATQGQAAEVLEETADGWFRIRLGDGLTAFIFGDFLSPDQPG